MRALRVHGWGQPPVIEDVPAPRATGGQTVVEIHAATVAHLDATIWEGAFLRPPSLPYTPGVEGAGVVVEGGPHPPGTRVWVRGQGLGTAQDGTWAEQVQAPDAAVDLLPDEVPMALGAAFFSPTASAWLSVHELGRVGPGEVVAVTGATGAVGRAACQLALEVGARVVALVSRPERASQVVPGAVAHVVGSGDPPEADVVIDTVGGTVVTALLGGVRPGGRIVPIGWLAGAEVALDWALIVQRDITIRPLNMMRREQEGRAALPEIFARLADGRLDVRVAEVGMDDAGAALTGLSGSARTVLRVRG